MPLPQSFRYSNQIKNITKRKLPETKKIAIMHHSVKSASVQNMIENVLLPLNIPVIYFSTRDLNAMEKLEILKELPKGSEVYGKVPREHYINFLNNAYIALDDNDGYDGWSRFALECAYFGVPCVGSMKAIQHIFPDLHTKHNDYNTQKQLLQKLIDDNFFHEYVMITSWIKAVNALSNSSLVTQFIKIAMVDLKAPINVIASKKVTDVGFTNFLVEILLRNKRIPDRPSIGVTIFDQLSKEILDNKRWDEIYGKWSEVINDKERYKRCEILARQRLYAT